MARPKPAPNSTCKGCGKPMYIPPCLQRRNVKFCSNLCKIKHPEVFFWEHVKKGKPEECWMWTGAKTQHPPPQEQYGVFNCKLFKERLAHRVSYCLAYGPIPKGMLVRHKCDHAGCCNPSHLELGTPLDNMQDMITRGRAKHAAGDDCPHSKLNESKARQIKRLIRAGKTNQEIAPQFGVHPMTINAIRTEQSWARTPWE